MKVKQAFFDLKTGNKGVKEVDIVLPPTIEPPRDRIKELEDRIAALGG